MRKLYVKEQSTTLGKQRLGLYMDRNLSEDGNSLAEQTAFKYSTLAAGSRADYASILGQLNAEMPDILDCDTHDNTAGEETPIVLPEATPKPEPQKSIDSLITQTH